MSKEGRGVKLYLDDIEGAIQHIKEYVRGLSFGEFAQDQKTIDAIVRNLEILGEAANNIPEELRARYTEVPWEKMVSMRNKVSHEYFGVDLSILWKTIEEDIPELKRLMAQIQ